MHVVYVLYIYYLKKEKRNAPGMETKGLLGNKSAQRVNELIVSESFLYMYLPNKVIVAVWRFDSSFAGVGWFLLLYSTEKKKPRQFETRVGIGNENNGNATLGLNHQKPFPGCERLFSSASISPATSSKETKMILHWSSTKTLVISLIIEIKSER